MGSCSGKSQTAPVVIIRRTGENSQRPQSRVSEGTTNSKINEQSVSENKEIDEETNFALSNVKGSQQEIPNMKLGTNYQQKIDDNRVFVQKEKDLKEEELNDNDVKCRVTFVY